MTETNGTPGDYRWQDSDHSGGTKNQCGVLGSWLAPMRVIKSMHNELFIVTSLETGIGPYLTIEHII